MSLKPGLMVLLTISLASILSTNIFYVSLASSEETGKVLCSIKVIFPDDRPAVGAKILIYNHKMGKLWSTLRPILQVETNETGISTVQLPKKSGKPTRVYILAIYDDPGTPGIDFFAYNASYISGETASLRMVLVPCAMIKLKGRLYLLGFPYPLSAEELGDVCYDILGSPQYIRRFGFLPILSPSTILVPAGYPIYLDMFLGRRYYWEFLPSKLRSYDRSLYNRLPLGGVSLNNPWRDKEKFLQGEIYTIDLVNASFRQAQYVLLKYLGIVEKRLLSLVSKGLVSYTMESELQMAKTFISRGEDLFRSGDVEGWFTYARRTLLTLERLDERIDDVEGVVETTALSLPAFSIIAALLISFILLERASSRMLATIFLTILFIAVISIAIPGIPSLLPRAIKSPLTLIAIGVAILLLLLGRFRRSLIVSMRVCLALARRNMRRMRLRTILLASTIAVTAFSFTFFFNVYSKPQLITETKTINPQINGILIKKVLNVSVPPVSFQKVNGLSDLLIKLLPEREWVKSSAVLIARFPNIGFSKVRSGYPRWGYTARLMLGFQFERDPITPLIKKAILKGRLPDPGSNDQIMIMIPRSASWIENISVGDYIRVEGYKFRVVALLDERRLSEATDLNGESISSIGVPDLSSDMFPRGGLEEPVLITTYEGMMRISPYPFYWRITLTLKDADEIPVRAEQLAYQLGPNYEIYASFRGRVVRAVFSEIRIFKAVPEMMFVIVMSMLIILNAVFSSAYERRRYAFILHTLGADPSRIAAIFLSEYILIAIISSILGYVAGVTFFPVLRAMNVPVEVDQKISIAWSLPAIMISLLMVMVSAFAGIRRGWIYWKHYIPPPGVHRSREIWAKDIIGGSIRRHILPQIILEEDAKRFLDYIEGEMKSLETLEGLERIWSIKRTGNTLSYFYRKGFEASHCTYNTIRLKKGEKPGKLIIEVSVRGRRDRAVEESLSFIRMLTIKWSHRKYR